MFNEFFSIADYEIKLSGFKYAKPFASGSSSGSSSEPRAMKFDVMQYEERTPATDKMQVAQIMYCWYKKKIIPQTLHDVFRPTWIAESPLPDDDNDFRKRLMKHLIKVMIKDGRLYISDLLCHPFFSSITELVVFEDRLRTLASARLDDSLTPSWTRDAIRFS